MSDNYSKRPCFEESQAVYNWHRTRSAHQPERPAIFQGTIGAGGFRDRVLEPLRQWRKSGLHRSRELDCDGSPGVGKRDGSVRRTHGMEADAVNVDLHLHSAHPLNGPGPEHVVTRWHPAVFKGADIAALAGARQRMRLTDDRCRGRNDCRCGVDYASRSY